MKNINKTKEKMKATIKNFNIDDVIYFDSKNKITLNKKHTKQSIIVIVIIIKV